MKAEDGVFSALFDELTDGICVSNGDGDVLYMNPAAERILGVSTQVAQSMDFCDLLCGHLSTPVCQDCKSHCPLREAGGEERAVTFAGRHGTRPSFLWQDEQIRRAVKWNDLRVRCLKMSTGILDPAVKEKHFTIIEDVSVDRELERRKEDWRSMVAHDLRAPLSNILVALANLLEIPDGQPLRQEERSLVRIARRSGTRMLELLNDYLDLAKLDMGKMPVRLEPVPLAALAKSCVEEALPMASAKGIEIVQEVPAELVALADPDLLGRVLGNLLNNAVKFTPEKGRVRVFGSLAAGRTCLSVLDTGMGIAEEDLPRIFDRFHQARARREGRVKGTGLGLTFCREALRVMNGEIEARSRPGAGSEFRVLLPAS